MILVTGATGFVGRSVVRALRTRGMDVRCLVHSPSRAKIVEDYQVEVAYGDVLDLPSLRDAMKGVDAVVHLVSVIRERGNPGFDRVNREGTDLVIQAAREEGVGRFVHMSAIGAQETPAYPYLYSKWQAEQAVRGSGLTYTILRPSIQFGEGDEFINTLAGVVKALPMVPIAGSGRTRLQPVSVEDVGALVSLVVDDPHFNGTTVEIGGPDYLTYDEIVGIIVKTLKVRRLRVHLPVPLMKVMVRLMELLPRPPATVSQLDMLATDNVTSMNSMGSAIKIRPRPLEGNIGYIRSISLWEAWRVVLGFMPGRMRDH